MVPKTIIKMVGKDTEYPSTKEILLLLGVGTLLAASIVVPGLLVAAGGISKAIKKREYEKSQKQWKQFNTKLLRRNIKRLHEQKVIEIINEKGQEVVKLTQKGKTKYLKLKLEDISNQAKSWDGKWRLVIYDVAKLKNNQRDNFRRVLHQMNFMPLQKSVYLTPYGCKEVVEYLREYFNLGEEVLWMEVSKMENSYIYEQYFGF